MSKYKFDGVLKGEHFKDDSRLTLESYLLYVPKEPTKEHGFIAKVLEQMSDDEIRSEFARRLNNGTLPISTYDQDKINRRVFGKSKLPEYRNLQINIDDYDRFYALAEKVSLMFGYNETVPPGKLFEMMLSFVENLVDEKDNNKVHYFGAEGGIN
jgi:hypothetical protein